MFNTENVIVKGVKGCDRSANWSYEETITLINIWSDTYMDRVKRIWYLLPMRAAKVQASLRIRAVSPEPSLLAHTSSESRGTFRQKARSLAPLNGWPCAVKFCHDGMLEDTNSLDGAHIQEESEKSRRNAPIFKKAAKKMIEAGYHRNMVQCQRKIKSMLEEDKSH